MLPRRWRRSIQRRKPGTAAQNPPSTTSTLGSSFATAKATGSPTTIHTTAAHQRSMASGANGRVALRSLKTTHDHRTVLSGRTRER
jgi:hypothetical protein